MGYSASRTQAKEQDQLSVDTYRSYQKGVLGGFCQVMKFYCGGSTTWATPSKRGQGLIYKQCCDSIFNLVTEFKSCDNLAERLDFACWWDCQIIFFVTCSCLNGKS